MFLIFVAIYMLCGVLSYGYTLAFRQTVEKDYNLSDKEISVLAGVFWPITLILTMGRWLDGGGFSGFKWK